MTILTPRDLFGVVRGLIDPIEQIQSAGIDLTVKQIERFSTVGKLAINNNERILPQTELVELDQENYYFLQPGGYIVRYNEIVHVPPDAAGVILPRSSLMRLGATLHSALWDPGYKGAGMGLLTVYNPIKIQKNSRIGQIIFFQLNDYADNLYNGAYQGEGIEN